MPRPRKRFAQHFLEPAWVRKVIDAIAPQPGDRILEIGPGRGALTRELAASGARVCAVEVDRDLASALEAELGPSVSIVNADVLRIDLPALVRGLVATPVPAASIRVVGNLPYNISSPILVRLVEVARATGGLRDAILMVQREVADRMTARPGTGDYGPLGISLQLWADVDRILALPPGAFRPPPKVSSALVRLQWRPPRVDVADLATFGGLVRAVFSHRRKTLANALKAFASGRGLEATTALAAAGLDGRRRPETLALAELAALARQFPESPTRPVL